MVKFLHLSDTCKMNIEFSFFLRLIVLLTYENVCIYESCIQTNLQCLETKINYGFYDLYAVFELLFCNENRAFLVVFNFMILNSNYSSTSTFLYIYIHEIKKYS